MIYGHYISYKYIVQYIRYCCGSQRCWRRDETRLLQSWWDLLSWPWHSSCNCISSWLVGEQDMHYTISKMFTPMHRTEGSFPIFIVIYFTKNWSPSLITVEWGHVHHVCRLLYPLPCFPPHVGGGGAFIKNTLKRALAIIIRWCVNKKGYKKEKPRDTSDLGLGGGVSAFQQEK